jgi:glycosyltransferase involved in cell wall biosynthesis
MEIKHIYWFAYFNIEEPSVRYRALFPLQQLKDKHGITFSIVYPGYDLKNIVNFIYTYFAVLLFRRPNSIIVFQKIYTTGVYTTALKILLFFRPQYTLYDIDDAEYTRFPSRNIHYFMKRCSACSSGSKALIEYIKRFNSNVFLLTSPVIDHGLIKTAPNDLFTIGWIGYYEAHEQSLRELFFPALYDIDFPIKLKLLGVADKEEEAIIKSYFEANKNIIVEAPLNLDWLDELSIYEQIRTFDIGVSPLIDDEFNRAKSAFKLKQCLSCGIPVLASSVGENNAFLEAGQNGYFCDTPNEYLQKLVLIKDASHDTYSCLSANAKMSFPLFSLDHYCATFMAYYQ